MVFGIILIIRAYLCNKCIDLTKVNYINIANLRSAEPILFFITLIFEKIHLAIIKHIIKVRTLSVFVSRFLRYFSFQSSYKFMSTYTYKYLYNIVIYCNLTTLI